MRKIDRFEVKGGMLVSIRDSITGQSSKSSWSGSTKRFWVKPRFVTLDGERGPCLQDPEEIYLLEADEPDPAPMADWCYARGFFG